MKKTIIPILLIASTYIIGQAYSFWDYNGTEKVNWILCKNVPMSIAWNIKYLSEEVNRILEATAFFMMLKGGFYLYRLVALEYLLYRILDIFFYFYSYKTTKYWYIFLFLGVIMAIVYLRNEFKKQKISI